MLKPVVTVNIVFPALDNLVAYLKARDDSQAQIDELAAKVVALTDGLQNSEAALKSSVDTVR
jgi:hypothetical protein